MSVRIPMICVLVWIVGCGDAQKKRDAEIAERTSSCEYECAGLAMALAESGRYQLARRPLANALEDAEDPLREDVPFNPAELMAHRLKLAVLGTVIARHVDSSSEANALDRLWKQVGRFVETRSYGSLSHTNVRFLNRADRGWLLRQLENTDALDERTRQLMALVWRVNSDFAPDRLLLQRLSGEAQTTAEHLLAAYSLCALDDCESDRVVVHLSALVTDQMNRPDDEVDAQLMNSWLVARFLKLAGPAHEGEVLWVRDYYRDHRLLPSWIPVNALGLGRGCREFAGMYEVVVRRRASYDALVIAARCAFALDHDAHGMRLLARADRLRDDTSEAALARWEYAFLTMDTPRMKSAAQRITEPVGAEQARVAMRAIDAISAGDERAAEVEIRKLPLGMVRSYLRGLVAFGAGDWATAEPLLASVFEHWTIAMVGTRLARARMGLDDLEGANEVTARGFALRPRHWAFLHGRVALARGDSAALDAAIKALDHSEATCSESGIRSRLVAASAGPAAGLAVLDNHLRGMRQPTARCVETLAWNAAHYAPTQAVLATSSVARLTSDKLSGVARGIPGCTKEQLEAGRSELSSPDTSPHAANNTAWFLTECGEFADALRVLPDGGDVPNHRDTHGRVLLGLGRSAEALATFAKLVDEYATTPTFQIHLLAAQLAANAVTDASEIESKVRRVIFAARINSSSSSFVIGTLADELERAGFQAQAQAVWRVHTDNPFSPPSWQGWKRIREKCAACVDLHRAQWERDPPGQEP